MPEFVNNILKERVLSCWENIKEAQKKRKHTWGDVQWVLATKKQKAEALLDVLKVFEAYKISEQIVFAESFLQEMRAKQSLFQKMLEVGAHVCKVRWHFIGRIQSKKIKDIAMNSQCIHTFSRRKELQLFAELLSEDVFDKTRYGVPSFFLQVNISQEETKNGFLYSELFEALDFVDKNKALKQSFLGFMALPSPLQKVGEQQVREEFCRLRTFRDSIDPQLKLNIGTSEDYRVAIEEGANILRLGTCIFGERE